MTVMSSEDYRHEGDEPRLRPYGPGKFNYIIDDYVYRLTLDGLADVYPDGDTSYTVLRGALYDPEIDAPMPLLTDAEVQFLNRQVGAILWERSDGIVEVTYFEVESELEDDVEEIEEATDEWPEDY